MCSICNKNRYIYSGREGEQLFFISRSADYYMQYNRHVLLVANASESLCAREMRKCVSILMTIVKLLVWEGIRSIWFYWIQLRSILSERYEIWGEWILADNRNSLNNRLSTPNRIACALLFNIKSWCSECPEASFYNWKTQIQMCAGRA